MAPPFEFLDSSFRPVMEKLGYRFSLELRRAGFYPAGGGVIRAEIEGGLQIEGSPQHTAPDFALDSREVTGLELNILYSGIPDRIVRAAAGLIGKELDIPGGERHLQAVRSPGPGWAASVSIALEDGKTVCTAFGERRADPETLAADCVRQVRNYLGSKGRVDEYLQDQLLLPLALRHSSLRQGGRFTTVEPSQHSLTNMEVIGEFLPVAFAVEQSDDTLWTITVKEKLI
jgi:RNA 3'-terminal phosphate cyclase (ATP)